MPAHGDRVSTHGVPSTFTQYDPGDEPFDRATRPMIDRPEPKPTTTVLDEAADITSGARQDAYGHPRENFDRIARGWSVIFGIPVTPRQVALAFAWTKIARDANAPGRDNLVDLAGYARTAEMLDEG